MIGRLGIDDVRPTVSGGKYPAKAVVGEVVPIFAEVWREGHDKISATLVLHGPKDSEVAPKKVKLPMRAHRDLVDQRHAIIVPDVPGTWRFRIDAWSDPMATWRHAVTAKIEAGQGEEELANDLEIGARLFERAARKARRSDRKGLLRIAEGLRQEGDLRARVAPGLAPETLHLLERFPVRDFITRGEPHEIKVERREALVSSWYELFPRSTGGVDAEGNPVHGTFATTSQALDRVKAMGFDTVYFPPIHPIGEVNRKGRNNTLTPQPNDYGSPWAIGSAAGGHDAVHPKLGTIEDFDALMDHARELGLEVALDLALQCAPDHPWAKAHPEWFTVLPDGTIAYAENPPKKYQDIYPLNFDNDTAGIYHEVLRVVRFWIQHGVTTFRVDNPHTKPANFWEWLIAEVHATNPEVIFLAEAFTRRPVLYGLGKVGFSQNYTYFTWRVTKENIEDFGGEISRMADCSRPNLFVNTPDILHASLQEGGPGAFAIRATLAATLSPLWGMYSGFELFERTPLRPGSEEYLNSEKYELRPRDFAGALANGESLEPYITSLNAIRREHPALQQVRAIHFHEVDNEHIVAYSKVDAVTGNSVLVVVNLDPFNAQSGTLHLDLEALGMEAGAEFMVHDTITGESYEWSDQNFVRLEPLHNVAHILELPEVPEERRSELAWRQVEQYSV